LIASGIDVVIVFYLLVMWIIVLTDGFFVDFLGVTLRATSVKNPLIVVTVLWLFKRIFLFREEETPRRLMRNCLYLFSIVAALLLLNYGVYSLFLDCGKSDFNSYRSNGDLVSQGGSEKKDWNVVLVSLDTLRADHLGCYGYGRSTSPAIDRLAAEGIRLENHIATAPSTLPSHASIFTSLYPSAHKAEFSTRTALSDDILTVTEVLKDEGYTTAAFTGGGQLDQSYRLDQGFDVYDDQGGGIARVVDRSVKWLRKNRGERFFLFVHTYETHNPYDPPPPYDSRFFPEYDGDLGREITVKTLKSINSGEMEIDDSDLQHIVAMYDGEIAFADTQVERLFRVLKKLDLWDDTLIILTSDHGEEFNEHVWVGWHSHTLYDELLQVPLIIRIPDGSFKGEVFDRTTRGVDVFPTLVNILGMEIPGGIQGVSLLPLWKGEGAGIDLPALSEREEKAFHKSLRYRRHKLILRGDFEDVPKTFAGTLIFGKGSLSGIEFFDVAEDPGETRNIGGEDRRLTLTYHENLGEMMEENRILARGLTTQEAEMDDALKKRLRALGYLQ
jgi:arylsulfatase A-like enzyme